MVSLGEHLNWHVKQRLHRRIARGVLATPPKEGFDLVAWIVPIVLVLAGLAAIPLVTRAWARRGGEAPAPEIAPEDAARLDEELRRRGE